MKIVGLFLLILCCPTLLYSQSDSSIFSNELKEIIVTSKQKEKIPLETFDLTGKKLFFTQSLRMPLFLDGTNSIGVFVPFKTDQTFSIKDISFPIFRFDNADTSLPFDYYLGIKYASGSDYIFQATPISIQSSDIEVKVSLNTSIIITNPIIGFYFFIKSSENPTDKHINVYYNNKYRSKFTRKLNNSDKVEYYDVSAWTRKHVNTAKEAKHVRDLNWMVKINYIKDYIE